jgi:hypothetical protein
MDNFSKSKESTSTGIHFPSASAKRNKERMEEYRRVKESAKISWRFKTTLTRLGIGEATPEDWAWFAMKSHLKTFDNLKD